MSHFWQFTITVGSWIFLVLGILAAVYYLVTMGSRTQKIIGVSIGCFITSMLIAMFVWVNGYPYLWK